MTAPEPKAKRTVEGDLGVYVNRMKVIESIGEEKLRDECENTLKIDLDKTLETYVAIPKNEDEFKLVERLTEEAVLRAVERHAGQIRYVYGPSGRQTVAEGKDLTQVKYIVGTGGALTRLPHRVDIMGKIAGDNLTGMKLYPSDACKILVDNDYIMASIGVLSKTHRQGAIRLLAKSLQMELAEKDHEANKAAFIEELQRMNLARQAKEKEHEEHIKEMEDMGYDMSEYKEALSEKIGGATKEEVEAAKEEAMLADRTVKKADFFAKETARPSDGAQTAPTKIDADANPHVMRGCGEVDGRPNCNQECERCMRKHCPYRKK